MFKKYLVPVLLLLMLSPAAMACSVLYYIDAATGKIYAVNNEDYWFDVKPYIKIVPSGKGELARLWYGWDNFAQGGINEAGLFFDGAATPDEPAVAEYTKPEGNMGDRLLSGCKTVQEALDFIEREKVALTNGHLLFGDRQGNAAVIEWTGGKKKIIPIADKKLMITNFLLTDTARGNYPCARYNAMEAEIGRLRQHNDTVGLKEAGTILAKAVQPATKNEQGKEGGTLYSVFVNITDMELVLVPKLDNMKKISLDLKHEFAAGKGRVLKME